MNEEPALFRSITRPSCKSLWLAVGIVVTLLVLVCVYLAVVS